LIQSQQNNHLPLVRLPTEVGISCLHAFGRFTYPEADKPTDLSAEGMEVGKPTDKCICAYLSFCFLSLMYIRKLLNRELK
jgi:hypothetical protein